MSDRDVERETTIIHTGDADRGSGGTIAAVLLLLAAIGLLLYLFAGDMFGGGGADTTDIKVDVEAPSVPSAS